MDLAHRISGDAGSSCRRLAWNSLPTPWGYRGCFLRFFGASQIAGGLALPARPAGAFAEAVKPPAQPERHLYASRAASRRQTTASRSGFS